MNVNEELAKYNVVQPECISMCYVPGQEVTYTQNYSGLPTLHHTKGRANQVQDAEQQFICT